VLLLNRGRGYDIYRAVGISVIVLRLPEPADARCTGCHCFKRPKTHIHASTSPAPRYIRKKISAVAVAFCHVWRRVDLLLIVTTPWPDAIFSAQALHAAEHIPQVLSLRAAPD